MRTRSFTPHVLFMKIGIFRMLLQLLVTCPPLLWHNQSYAALFNLPNCYCPADYTPQTTSSGQLGGVLLQSNDLFSEGDGSTISLYTLSHTIRYHIPEGKARSAGVFWFMRQYIWVEQ